MRKAQTILVTASIFFGTGVACDSAPELLEPSAPSLSRGGVPSEVGFVSGTLRGGGNWSYRWNSATERYGLTLHAGGRNLTDLWCQDHPELPFCGGISGFSGFLEAFVHIFAMKESVGGMERTVIVAAWGNRNIFEAAVLPDTPENRNLVFEAAGRPSSEVVEVIKAVIVGAEDVLVGETQASRF